MRINTNISALNAHRQLMVNTEMSGKAMEKLSSGLRINRAGDDAAGLAISEKMRGQIRGLRQASRNAQDGISLIQTAEGALSETQAILQKMRELAVQSASSTNTETDRAEIQNEINQLADEISRIAEQTEFNTQKLLDGSFENVIFHIGANKGQNIKLSIGAMDAVKLGVGFAESGAVDGEGFAELVGGLKVKNLTGEELTIKFAEPGENVVSETTASYENGTVTITLKQAAGEESNPGEVEATLEELVTALEALKGDDNNPRLAVDQGDLAADFDWDVEFGGYELKLNAAGDPGETTITGLNVSTQEDADLAIETIQKAIDTVSAQRSMLGAYQNRLEHTIANLGTSAENLQAAESRIRDVDMAEEIMEFTKANILNQAATAMLAQANIAPQTVLQLLG